MVSWLSVPKGQGVSKASQLHTSLQDARVVLAYGPKDKGQHGVCSWPWAHSLHSAALEGLQVLLNPLPL